MNRINSNRLRKYIKTSLVLSLIFIQIGGQAAAISAVQKNIYNSKIYYFDESADGSSTGCSGTSSPADTTPDNGTANGSTLYQSGLQPPYILEEFAINVLKDIAQKKGVAETDVVTQEHIVALIAFMWGEGGDIANDDLFNPLNSGLNAPELINGASSTSGLQSYKSFDAGVEATARTMLGSFQSRLGNTLVDPTSTAREFMHALSYYQDYPGNKFWAQASEPPNQASYYQGRLSLVAQVRANYKDMASTIIGTASHEEVAGLKDPSKLQFQNGGAGGADDNTPGDDATDTGCTNASDDTGNSIVAGNIIQTAINLAWPQGGHGKDQADARPTYQAAEPKYNGSTGDDEFSDCGVFVSTVMIASGVDTSYPKRGTGVQQSYVMSSDKYTIINNISDTSQLQPGDILIYNNGADGHTFIYTGPLPGGYDGVGASLHGHVPEAVNSIYSITYDGRAGHFIVARHK